MGKIIKKCIPGLIIGILLLGNAKAESHAVEVKMYPETKTEMEKTGVMVSADIYMEAGVEKVLAEKMPENEEVLFSDYTEKEIKKNNWKQNMLEASVVVVGILLIFELLYFSVRICIYEKRRKKEKRQKKKKGKVIQAGKKENPVDENTIKPIVIQADKICMDFDRAVNEYTSIKELVIQTIKGKRIKEKYRALENISFEIRKGEVIGVIGTNGAGKSTLLKIIAGALRPTGGSIHVNQDKVQILTLGTGFDMELSGKENVYLNGAIIGYEKEFIDKYYEQIVEFAELKDFMNEKVKNYSSGMVSRLGFAIATVGKAAEILILDEVLSVGDRIFREKSMKRIKEMIHGGSTVIMVSHSTKTISENCDKALWIEKGKMIAFGDAVRVCTAYEKYDGEYEKLLKMKENVKRK